MRTSIWCILALVTATQAFAQQPGGEARGVDVLMIAGTRNTIIEDTCANGGGQVMFGGAVNYHGEGRRSAGAEMTYLRPCASQTFTFYHPRLGLMAQARIDLNRRAVTTVYLVGGVGATRHVSQFAPSAFKIDYIGGVGVRIRHGRLVIAPELQIGGPALSARLLVSLGAHVR